MDYAKQINVRLMLVTFVILLSASIGLSFFVAKLFQQQLAPEIERKAFVIGDTLRTELTRATGLGIPFLKLREVDRIFTEMQSSHSEIQYIVATDLAGRILYRSGDVPGALQSVFTEIARAAGSRSAEASAAVAKQPGLTERTRAVLDGKFYNTTLPLDAGAGLQGHLHIGSDAQLSDAVLFENMIDVVTVLFVSLLVVFELLLCLIGANISDPIRRVDRALGAAQRNDFTARVGWASSDEIGRFVRILDGTLDGLGRRFQAVADRVRGAGATGTALAPRVAALAERYKFAVGAPKGLGTERGIRFIRAALFLFIFAESLSLSFFPVFTKTVYEPIPGISTALAVGLPISLFWLFVALVQPAAGRWSQTHGYRGVFTLGAAVTAVGLLLTAYVGSYWELLLWRGLTALGYGVVFLVCQGYIMDHMPRERATEGAATFTSAFFSATICGTAIGAILAEQLGFRIVFLASAWLAMAAATFVYLLLKGDAQDRGSVDMLKSVTWRWRDLGVVLRNFRFLALVFFCAVPARLLNGAFLLYLGPLYLNLLDNSRAEVGRIMVIYAVIMALTTVMWARVADRRQSQLSFAIVGSFVSGLAMLGAVVWQETAGVIVSITLMGFAQALGMPSQVSLVPIISAQECRQLGRATVIGLFRVFERIGSIAGPIVAAVFIGLFGYPWTMGAIGILVLTSSVILLGVFMFAGLGAPQAQVREAGE